MVIVFDVIGHEVHCAKQTVREEVSSSYLPSPAVAANGARASFDHALGWCSGSGTKTKHHPFLKGLRACAPCDCCITYCWSKRGPKIYSYYTCARSRDHGADTCPIHSLPAADLERLVVEEIAAICRDPSLTEAVTIEAVTQHRRRRRRLQLSGRLPCSTRPHFIDFPEHSTVFSPLASEWIAGHATRS